MTDIKRRVAITRKVSLADYADDWQNCYAIVILADFEQVREIAEKDFTDMNQVKILAFEIDVVKKNFVSGKIKVLDDNGSSQLVDMTPDDIEASTQLADMLYAVIMGISIDPKGSRTEAPDSSTPSPSVSTTKTSSSTASVPASPNK